MNATSFGVGLILAALIGLGVYEVAGAAEYDRLCPNGHVARRASGVTYGGLRPRYGYERDHVVPLCLGGPDTRSNVTYEPYGEARRKDELERSMCESYCHGGVKLDDAREFFASGKWRQYILNCCN